VSIMQAVTAAPPRAQLPATINVTSAATTPSTATSLLRLTAGGDIERTINAANTDIGDWLVPKAGMTLYEARLVTVSGTLSAGTTDTWQALSSNRAYSVQRNTIGVSTFVGTLEIRRTGTTGPVASSSVTLQATQEA
jgi:hypothetical protein